MLLLAAAASIAAAIYSASTVNQLRFSISAVTRTLHVQKTIGEVLAENQDVETQALRYLLSLRPDFLGNYQRSLLKLDDEVGRLERLTADNPGQVEILAQLRSAIYQRNDWFREAIELSQARGLEAISARIREGHGAIALRRIGDLAAVMAQEEARQLLLRQQELDRIIVQTTVTSLMVNVLALVVGGIALASLRRGARDMEARRIAQLRADQAAQASQEKSAFLASMSHEIRTPMNAVFGFTQLLAKTRVEPQARSYIKAIQTSGRALLALINDILDLSKIEAGKLPLSPQATDIRELLDSTLGVFAESAGQKRLALQSDVAPSVPSVLVVDPHRLRQVLMNLVSNAVKYSDRGNVRLTVGSSEPDAFQRCDLHIAVSDTGIGIPKERQTALFEPFYRAGGDGDTREGTGLGLAIVRRLLSLMDGDISLVSEPGVGSTFSVRLRGVAIASGAADPLDDDEAEADFARLRPSRILIVDDVAWNRELLAAFLAEGEHELEFAADGQDAVETAARFKPDLVLMDLRMPVMDGREAGRRIRQAAGHAAPKVVAISASSMSREDLDVGTRFDAYIRKPIEREVLFQVLATQLGLADSAPGAADGEPSTAADETTADVASDARQAAIERLLRIARVELPAVRATMRVAEVKRLAEVLAEIGTEGGLVKVVGYSRRLLTAVDRFDVLRMETLLQGVGEHVVALGQPPRPEH
jgi:signal transduction histidine kinase/DNA-binding response OmpR family regulator